MAIQKKIIFCGIATVLGSVTTEVEAKMRKNVTTDGDYFVSPEELDGTTEFRFTGDHR